MKKRFLFAGLCMTVAATLAICACSTGSGNTGNGGNGGTSISGGGNGSSNTGDGGNGGTVTTVSALNTANDVYGMGAVSTVKLLGSEMAGQAMQTFSAVRAATVSDVKVQAEKFNEYFTALDGFFGEDVVTTVSEKNTDENYQYENKLTVNGKNFDGETVTHVMYYTETLVTAGSVLDDKNDLDDDRDDIDDDKDDDLDDHDDIDNDNDDKDDETETETESVYKLVGVMVVDGKDYYMEGERTEESEKDETESELKIRAYADNTDRLNYVEMEQEYSEEAGETETEYVYGIYANGKLVEQTAVEFEKENKNGKEEVEYELEFRSGEGKGRYEIERETKDGNTAIKVNYNINGDKGQFRITEIEVNGEKKYEYTFSNGDKEVFDK